MRSPASPAGRSGNRAWRNFTRSCRDPTYPAERALRPGAGSVVAAIEVAAGTKPVAEIGKPGPLLLVEAAHAVGASAATPGNGCKAALRHDVVQWRVRNAQPCRHCALGIDCNVRQRPPADLQQVDGQQHEKNSLRAQSGTQKLTRLSGTQRQQHVLPEIENPLVRLRVAHRIGKHARRLHKRIAEEQPCGSGRCRRIELAEFGQADGIF